jgi:hypothetical protein
MRASLLAQPGIDDGLSACCRAGVEHVPHGLLVEPDQREHDLVVAGNQQMIRTATATATATSGSRGGQPPRLMASGLPDSLGGGGFLVRLGREVVERLQERDRDLQELADLLFGVGEPRVELVCAVDDRAPGMSSS